PVPGSGGPPRIRDRVGGDVGRVAGRRRLSCRTIQGRERDLAPLVSVEPGPEGTRLLPVGYPEWEEHRRQDRRRYRLCEVPLPGRWGIRRHRSGEQVAPGRGT